MLTWRAETFEQNNWLLEMNNLVLTVPCWWCIALQKPLQERYVYVDQVSYLHKLQQLELRSAHVYPVQAATSCMVNKLKAVQSTVEGSLHAQ